MEDIYKINENYYTMHREESNDPKYRKKLEKVPLSDGYIGFESMK